MSGFGMSSKSTRSYGDFSGSSTASSLFDAAFSKPVVKKRFNKFPSARVPPIEEPILPSVSDEHNSPQQVFSPPISLPESSSTDGNTEDRIIEESDESDDDESIDIAAPKAKISRNSPRLTQTTSTSRMSSGGTSNPELKRPAPSSSAYDFDDDAMEIDCKPKTKDSPAAKKEKKEHSASPPKAKFMPKERRNVPIYRHKWTTGGEDKEEEDFDQPKTSQTTTAVTRDSGSRIRRVLDAAQCMESGELDDYRQDVMYLMSSLNDPDASANVKCLSAFSLAKKCASRGFRQFIRNETGLNYIIKLFPDAAKDPNLALCVSAFIYVMARDFTPMKIDSTSFRIIAQLLKMDKVEQSAEAKKYVDKIWQVFNDYLDQTETLGKRCKFDIPKEDVTPSALILEALVYLLARNQDLDFKTEFMNHGCLTYVVTKIEQVILTLLHDKTTSKVDSLLLVLERAFRIVEHSTTYHKKNQNFLISHRASVILQMCGKLTALVHDRIPQLPAGSPLIENFMKCLSLVARVLCNLSHDSELCSSKLGQIDGFLLLCLQSFTYLAPKYGTTEKKFDLMVMMLGLLVNLVEKVNSNRNKVLNATVQLYHEDGTVTEEKALNALVMRFVMHEEKARSIDEDLDRELAFEEPVEENSGDDEEASQPSQNGRLDRGKMDDMSEAEMLDAVQKAMGKASAHMEDSVVASYLALVVGCLLQQHDEHLSGVKALLPNGDISALREQLQRFQDFMKIANPKSRGCSSIGKIIGVLDDLEKFS